MSDTFFPTHLLAWYCCWFF